MSVFHFVPSVPGFLTRTKKFIFRTIRRLPYVGKWIDAKLDKQMHELEEKFHEMAKGQSYLQKLPPTGMSEVKLLTRYLCLMFFFAFC